MPPIVHKLTAAMMLEPSTGSKLLAEELDNELDEGAEGIDNFAAPPRPQIHVRGTDGDGAGELSLTSAERGPQLTGAFEDVPTHGRTAPRRRGVYNTLVQSQHSGHSSAENRNHAHHRVHSNTTQLPPSPSPHRVHPAPAPPMPDDVFLASPCRTRPPRTGAPPPPCAPPVVYKLVVAMMPEASAGSKLAEELGIEFDEGTEGIDNFAAPPRPQMH
ncbi:hypothetical protein FB451DRAFT_1403452 [Mycena latifolia]|nr:hypothetical protein FB451DRAFT_1403452 [Mycena latifolia]